MDEPVSRQEQIEGKAVTPAEVWEHLSPEVQARVTSLLAKMAYKCVSAQYELLLKKPEKEVGDVSPFVEPQGESDSP